MFLSEMKIQDIEFGDTEGKREFNSSEKISNMFFKDFYRNEPEKFISGKLRYIYGLKGTGKTSLLKYLEDTAISRDIKTMYISYKDIKEEADIIHEFRSELKNSDDQDTYTLTFWRWYLLSLISKMFLNESKYDANNLIYNSKVKFFRLIASLLDMISDVTVGTEEAKLNISIGNAQLDIKWDSQTSSRIRYLEKTIKEKLSDKIIIFIDELEISKLLSTYDVDAVLVKNLIRATRKLNDLNENLHIVLAVRSEVVGSIAVAGDEINKELEDFGYEIEWHRRKFDISHPLLSMYIQKMRYSMKIYAKKIYFDNIDEYDNIAFKINKMNNSTIWYRWFPKFFGSIETPEFILQNTWLRPRDLSRLFRTMQKYSHYKHSTLTQSSYAEAIKKVGEESWQEIAEEFSSTYTVHKIEAITSILEKMQIIFLKDKFIEEASIKGINEEEATKILNDLYRVSAIGNCYVSYNNGKFSTTYRFAYRNDKSLYEDRAIYIHRVIQHALGLTEFNKDLMSEHLSPKDKKKYQSQPYINNNNTKDEGSENFEEVFNLQDALRESNIRVR